MSLAIRDGKPTAAGWGAILSVFMILGSLSVFTPALRIIGASFPDAPQTTIALMSTLPGLCLIPTNLICGVLVDRGVKFKPLLIIGVICYILTGLMPMLNPQSLTLILWSRVLFGLSLGISMPLANAAVLRWYAGGDECAKRAGQGTGIMLLLTVFFQIGSGYIAQAGWTYVCLIHLIGIVPLIWVFISWPEPEKVIKSAKEKAQAKDEARAAEAQAQKNPNDKINPRIIWVYLVFWVNCAMMSIVFLNSAYFIAAKGLGDSVLTGYFGAIVTVTGFVFGMLFGKFAGKLGRFTVGVGPICLGLGMLIIYFANGVVGLILGAIVCGIGFCIPQPGLVTELALFVPKRFATISSAFQQAFKAVANYLAGYFVALVNLVIAGATPVTLLICAAVLSLVIGAIFCIARVFKKLPEPVADTPVE